MMVDMSIAQAIVVRDHDGPSVAARSADFPFAWEDAVVTAAVRFGQRPPGVACPQATFAVPVGRGHVAVAQVADLPGRSGEDPPLGFRFLVLGRELYALLGDPFAVADRFPPNFGDRGSLEPLEWPAEPLPARTVELVKGVLEAGDSPLLLGAAQAVTDGGRVLIESPTPAEDTLRGLWQLLPDRTRAGVWPASFAFGPDLGCHAMAVPVRPDPWPSGVITADQARDYPEGRYELALQSAAESGDQAEIDRLFARRSVDDMMKVAAGLVAIAVVAAIAGKFIG